MGVDRVGVWRSGGADSVGAIFAISVGHPGIALRWLRGDQFTWMVPGWKRTNPSANRTRAGRYTSNCVAVSGL